MNRKLLNQSEIVRARCAQVLVALLLGTGLVSFYSSAVKAQVIELSVSAVAAPTAVAPVNSVSATNKHLAEASVVPPPTPAPRTARQRAPLDFNGDNKTDYVIVRSADINSPSFWFINTGSGLDAKNGQQWGQGVGTPYEPFSSGGIGDFPVPADYDGDGRADFAVWRRGAQGYFYILQSSNNTFRAEAFGQTGDDPSVVADYDGDGKTDLAVYRHGATTGAQNYFYYRPSAAPGVNLRTQPWGVARYVSPSIPYSGDAPYPGDYDGDGRADFIVQRGSDFTPTSRTAFHILKSSGGFESVTWGLDNDVLVPGDYDGDGKTDICVQRSHSPGGEIRLDARYYFIRYANGSTATFAFGRVGVGGFDVPGDYDGDGRTDIAVYDRLTGVWSILPTTGAPPFYFYWGQVNTGQSRDTPPAIYIIQQPIRFVS